MQTNQKIAYYQLGRLRVPDYLPGILVAIFLLFCFPFVVQSQQSAEIRAEEVADGRYVLFGRGGNILASLGDQGDDCGFSVPRHGAEVSVDHSRLGVVRRTLPSTPTGTMTMLTAMNCSARPGPGLWPIGIRER